MDERMALEFGRAWPEWQWACGQIAIVHHPRLTNIGTVVQVADGRPTRIVYDDLVEFVRLRMRPPVPLPPPGMILSATTDPSEFEILPDFRDPGTRGHALDQVRKAWGPRCTYDISFVLRPTGGWRAELYMWNGDDWEVYYPDGRTRDEAETRALLMARRWAP